jgi:hypothetical protein
MKNPYTPARAARHATLVTRLTNLLRQVELVAKSRPAEAVSPAVLRLGEDLLFEAREFRPRGERRGLPAAPSDQAGLAAALGQALAMLEIWSVQHPAPAGPNRFFQGEDMQAIREKLARRIEVQNAGIFEAGRRAGLAENREPDQTFVEPYPRVLAPD